MSDHKEHPMTADEVLAADPELGLALERALRRGEMARARFDAAPTDEHAAELRAASAAVDAIGEEIERRIAAEERK